MEVLFRPVLMGFAWLIFTYSEGKLPWWVFPALVASIVAGAVVGWVMSLNVFFILVFAGLGFLLSVSLLGLFAGGQELMQDNSRRDTIKGMTNEQLLRIVTSGFPEGWTDDDFAFVERTLMARGVEVPEQLKRPSGYDFQRELNRIFRDAQEQHLSQIDVLSGDLHRELGAYPGTLTLCCDVMQRNVRSDDEILDAPPKGQGATLRIRYRFPR